MRKRGTQTVEHVIKKEGKVAPEEESIQNFEFERTVEVLRISRTKTSTGDRSIFLSRPRTESTFRHKVIVTRLRDSPPARLDRTMNRLYSRFNQLHETAA